jgi:C4-dicarboxylate transporter DctQ subunit
MPGCSYGAAGNIGIRSSRSAHGWKQMTFRCRSFLRFFEGLVNEGEAYEKMPRFIPYAVLPLSMALLLFRFLQAGWEIVAGERTSIIAGHEAEEMIAQTAAKED